MTGRKWRTVAAVAAGIVLLGLAVAAVVNQHIYRNGLNVNLKLYAVFASVFGIAAAGCWALARLASGRPRR